MNTKLIREQVKFQVVIENNNASGLHRWINDMVVGQVFTMTFLQVLQNLGQKMLFLLPLPTPSQTTTSVPPIQEKKKKTQKKIETLLE